MATRLSRGSFEVIGNSPTEINLILQRIREELDEIQGLRGPAKIFSTFDLGGNRIDENTDSTRSIRFGTGSPEDVVTAGIGSIFLRTDGGTNTTLYVKQSGTGKTGWIAK